jgi:hypothetical protein
VETYPTPLWFPQGKDEGGNLLTPMALMRCWEVKGAGEKDARTQARAPDHIHTLHLRPNLSDFIHQLQTNATSIHSIAIQHPAR